MDFRHRAHTALERKAPGRALMLLVRGLRREPDHDAAVDLLLHIYIHHIAQPGLESELFRGLEYHPERALLLRVVVTELHEEGKPAMAKELRDWAHRHDIVIASEPVSADEDEAVEPVDVAAHSDASSAHNELEPEPESHNTADAEGSGIPEFEVDDRAGDDELKDEETQDERSPSRAQNQGTKREVGKPRRHRVLLLAVGALAAVIAVSVIVVGWQHAQDSQRMRIVDEAMITLDALASQEVLLVLDEVEPAVGGGTRQFMERRRFIAVVQAIEEGQGQAGAREEVEDLETSWGLAAAALEATHRGQWEEAMRFAHQLERSHGDTLPTYFAMGRICEARRDWDCAIARYSRIQQHFPAFVPAYAGSIRIAAHQFDAAAWRQMTDRIAELDSEHHYAQLRWNDPFVDPFVDADRGAGDADDTGSEEIADLFVRRWQRVTEIGQFLRDHRWDEALQTCTELLDEGQWRLGLLKVYCARAAAGGVDVGRSWIYFEAAAFDDTLPASFHRRVQILAPSVLTDLGRPDLAMSLTIPFDDEPLGVGDVDQVTAYVAQAQEGRPPHFRASGDELDNEEASALLVRSQVLLALGATQQARRALAPIMTWENLGEQARFELAWSHLVEGNRESALRAIAQIGEEQLAAGARAYLAYLEGRYDEARDFIWEKGDDLRLLRIQVLAFLAEGRGREAMVALQAVDKGLEAVSLLTLKMHVFSRIGDEASLRELDEFLVDHEDIHTIDHLIDLAQALFWQRELTLSTELLERVLKFVPHHPEANWQMGLRSRMEGEQGAARLYFQRAWRSDTDSTELLIESGRVHLEFGRYEQAREVFLRTVLRDRRNVDAIAGLGQAYEEGDRRRGRRDLEELLQNYSTAGSDRPARAEMTRWLAIVHGSRRGEEDALVFLERAEEASGGGALIFSEFGRFYAARQEWEEARDYYGKALRIDPTLPDVHLGLAQVAKASGEFDAARDHLGRLLRLVPAAEVRREAQTLLDELDEALP